jgi:acetyl-CoA acetyltransferase
MLTSQQAAIAGVGETDIGRLPDEDSLSLHVKAAKLAIDDAGIDKHDIDGILTSGSGTTDNIRHHMVVSEQLGLHCKSLADTLRTGGQSWGHGLQLAQWAVQSGRCKAVLLVGGDNQLSNMQPGGALKTYASRGAHSLEFEIPYEAHVPGIYGLVAARHMHEFGTTPEQLAAIAVACRKHAGLNPKARKRDPITVEDVINSRMVASPLHLLDCSVVADGGGALIVTTLERARDLKAKPVRLLGLGQAQSYYYMGFLARAVGQSKDRKSEFDLVRTVQSEAAAQAFGEAGITPDDIDVAQLYDSFTITVLLQLEDLGFCKKGEGGAFAEGGRLELGGGLPINTYGGMLSFAHTGTSGGLHHFIEAARQLRGECGDRQVSDAEVAIATNVSAVASNHSLAILGKD